MGKRRNRTHPSMPLAEAEALAQLIRDKNAAKPMNRVLLAGAADTRPSSSRFRELIMSSARYGLTEGSYSAAEIALTPLGESLTAPRNTAEHNDARRSAFLSVPIFAQLFEHYSNNEVPGTKFLQNTLERDPFNVDPEWSEEVSELFLDGGRSVGLIRDISGSTYAINDGASTVPESATSEPEETYPISSRDDESPSGAQAGGHENMATGGVVSHKTANVRPMQIFVAHGKSRKPLDQLKKILDEWKVPFLVAVDEPNAGRPISQKVADLMKDCTAGIFIFTRDTEYIDGEQNRVFRPSENVIYELGAASLLYGRKIVILKESGVIFPSDFSDLGWIEFEEDALDAKAMELLRELIALDAVKLVSVGGK